MNSKIYGDYSQLHTWASSDELGRQISVLGTIPGYKDETKVIDVCNLCKTDDAKMSPDSVIDVDYSWCDGCRQGGSNLSIIGGGEQELEKEVRDELEQSASVAESVASAVDDHINKVIDAEEQDKVQKAVDEVELSKHEEIIEPELEGDYVEESNVQPNNDNTYVSENDTVIEQEETQLPVEVNEPSETGCTECEKKLHESVDEDKVEVIGVDKEAFNRFCSGQMNSIEYALNITIIIIAIAISVIAINTLFKIAVMNVEQCYKCHAKGGKLCPKCGGCERCCVFVFYSASYPFTIIIGQPGIFFIFPFALCRA